MRTFDLEASIKGAKDFKTYDIANMAERVDELLIDKLDDESIEIHSNVVNRESFNNALSSFIDSNHIDCKIKLHTEYMYKNGIKYRMQYAVLSDFNNLNGGVSC